MQVKTISITKSRTFGTTTSANMKFNKVIITMDGEVSEAEDPIVAYNSLSDLVDQALESEATQPPASIIKDMDN